ncbi:GH92 family glycosyl hydrolase [Rhodohalobacter sulfatireducens]|uniref:GH92 family glycosyl hydrolase n=1 Tax=Rhodohalobacter sulfatireducens TaxID=2911366 RepID=A0ABS9KAP4_9BACT|nr:GH92 family glycosyl hydrolase [Rhodohalobacter sulfatireducens]MCG2587923.1 GH92 family glycosyl hydrolase [Rhodohalobacter sulfatireducens]
MKKIKYLILYCVLFAFPTILLAINTSERNAVLITQAHHEVIWSIGEKDNLADEFALAPDGFEDFKYEDFGYEDNFFAIGFHDEKEDIPYVLPGPVDTWGGTWPTSGWRSNSVNILFSADEEPENGNYTLYIELADFAKEFLPVVKVHINGQEVRYALQAEGYSRESQRSPARNEEFINEEALRGEDADATPTTISIPIDQNVIQQDGNEINITILEGSWIKFDQVRLEGPELKLRNVEKLFVRDVRPAEYQVVKGQDEFQPLLVKTEHFEGSPLLSVELDGEQIFEETVEMGQYDFEVLMPAVSQEMRSEYAILIDGRELESGSVERSPQQVQALSDYVDTRMGAAHARWMYAPGPWMPFSMVKLSPINQNSGWQAGYDSIFESVGAFSHIHEWTMAGLGVFPTNGRLQTQIGDELKPDSGYRSRIDKKSEEAPIGYYKVNLTDYDIQAELTATTRSSLMRFTFPEERDSARVLIDFHIPAEYDYVLKEVNVRKVSDYRLEGYSDQFSGRVWSSDAQQDYTVHFVMEFDQPILSMGGWVEDEIVEGDQLTAKDITDAGLFIYFDHKEEPVVQVRTGISLVSIENAAQNLETEMSEPFGWDFEAVRQHQVDTWNELMSRVLISTNNRLEKKRFYNTVYRSLSTRNTWSDVNGEWRGTDGSVHKLMDPDHVALGCDAFWNTFWNLNQFWNLVTPEWSSRWVNSQLAMYDAYGWLAKGPAGMNYIPVMVAEHEIPLITGAYQMGIRDFDADKALEAAVKMQNTPAQKVHDGFAGNRDLTVYLEHEYVPYDKGRFSNSMEYSFDDWTVGQLAKAIGKSDVYETFNDRGYWWKNAISDTGFAHMRDSDGNWLEDFDPFASGANHHYVEGNAWQLTHFVPQDVTELIHYIGKERFVDNLIWGFEKSYPLRFNAVNDQYWDIPVDQGNQQSLHFSFLFNWAGKPWLTQKWSRAVMERFYGFGVGNAYLGDEDQGQLSAWFVMASIGLFQTDGGTRVDPIYEIASPLFERVEIDLGGMYGRGETFVIEAKNASRNNKYVQSATLNGQELDTFYFDASELLKGGSLILEMGPEPNKEWGVIESE